MSEDKGKVLLEAHVVIEDDDTVTYKFNCVDETLDKDEQIYYMAGLSQHVAGTIQTVYQMDAETNERDQL